MPQALRIKQQAAIHHPVHCGLSPLLLLLLCHYIEMMNVKVKIHDLEDEDCLEESSRPPLNLTISADSNFEDLKQRIEEVEDHDLGERQLLVGFYPAAPKMKLKDIVEDGDIITASIATGNSTEDLTVSNLSMETIYMIVGRRDNFDILPFLLKRGSIPRTLHSSFHRFHNKFGIVRETQGAPGERIFNCYIYAVKDGARVEIRGGSSEVQIFQYIGTKPVEVQVDKIKVYKESELIKSRQNLRDAVKFISVLIGGVSRTTAAAAGISG